MRPAEPRRDSQIGQLLPAAAVAMFTIVMAVAAVHVPPKQGEMGVVFAPWTSQAEILGAVIEAGGRIVDTSRLPNVIVAYGLDEGFAARIRDRGAWFTIAAIGLCAGTGSLS
ncbi:hypothetical protein N8A98_10720 [Devosia neptuniae]|uniref:Uncharacterized protein n=1 Tax=Devosia neptuniae TaxID=191302 RepID=A0ABY6CHA1_9HYPH|nr:hypothetical protein [Devosia neptuniae]UXN71617.1 hypothetical protein N8A98_10720 [Devosia neptuniae]